MKPLWICSVCGEGIHAYTRYVVLLMSWDTTERQHVCGECWIEMMRLIQKGLGVWFPGARSALECST